MKLIKKYKFGNRLAEEESYWDETPEDFMNSLDPLKTSMAEAVPDFEEMGKWYARNPSARGAAGGNPKAHVVHADGKNPGYYILPQVKPNTSSTWRNTITSELEKFLEVPYNFGGKRGTYMQGITKDDNPPGEKHPERLYAGIDCSGFVQWFAKDYLGIDIDGTAKHEYDQLKKLSGHEVIVKKNGNPVAFNVNDVLPGDVIYFGNKNHSKRHIGIIHSIKDGKIYYTNAAGNDIAKVCTIPIDDYVDSHANVYITSLRKDRNYNQNQWTPGNYGNWDFNNVTKNTQNGQNGWYYNSVLNFNNTGENIKQPAGVVNTNNNNSSKFVNWWDIHNSENRGKNKGKKRNKTPKYNS